MTIIFLAEYDTREKAKIFSQHFEGISWTLKDDIECKCHTEIKEGLEGNWWCSLSVSCIDWIPSTKAEANYRLFQILDLQIDIGKHLQSAPDFRYAFRGEVGQSDLDTLLNDGKYRINYQQLNLELISLIVSVCKIEFILPESKWREIGEPAKFKPCMSGYVSVHHHIPIIISGGVKAPPREVITGKTLRIFVDPNQAATYIQQAGKLIEQGQFVEGLDNLEKAQKLNPLSTTVLRLKACAFFSLNRLDEALQHCNTAIKFALPQSDEEIIVYQLKGDILYKQGKLKEALEAFTHSLELKPNNYYAVRPWYRNSLILTQLEQYEEALNACNSTLELVPDASEVHELRLEILESLINIGEAKFLDS